MPTRGRPAYARQALECFQSQTYEPRELIVLDDIDAPSFDGGLGARPGVIYEVVRRRMPVGEKRNLCCSRANGDVIVHWDDDDWSAPERIADQVERLIESGKPMTGYRSMRLTDGARWWLYNGAPDYALGTSLMYTREFWEEHRFTSEHVGEDVSFWAVARGLGAIASADAGEMMWARIHPGNTSAKEPGKHPAQWRLIA